MVGILLDTKYSESLWCKSLYESLITALRQKRIAFCELCDTYDKGLDAVFIIASDREWTVSAITQLNRIGVKPIVICNQSENLSGCIYSCVCSDINASMKNLLDTLKYRGKSRVALYGINTDSIPDISRVDSLFNWRSQYFETMNIFNNNGSLEKCFNDFYPHISEFDAIICANDFAAISLVRRLHEAKPEKLKDLCIISCAQTQLSNYYRKYILSLNMNFEQYGKAAVYVYIATQKHAYISEMTVKVLWSLESNEPLQLSDSVQLNLKSSADSFYSDNELAEMLIVDRILKSADDIEKTIIDCLTKNEKTEKIADVCFLTAGAVKYRINKMVASSGAKDRKEMVALLKKYIYQGNL
ncbi:MAG: LacI family DNA-binding transcriptional regulator [Clostridia bacterium]|nr:LacI family DNA-binding transcriptional regulator [Clostridia bacterium]